MHVARTLAAAFPDRMSLPTVVEKLVNREQLGKKSGKGFYLYEKSGESPNPDALALRSGDSPAPSNLQEHLAGLMSAEAQLCLDERVAETPEDIDLAMVLGTGYAPFRGGPLEHHKNTSTP